MTGINHAVTGALVAAAINKPALALPAALLSHFAADIIPHWNYRAPRYSARHYVAALFYDWAACCSRQS
jgi:hypothetical protein